MKSILFIDTGIEYGGGTKSLLYLLDELNKKNEYKITVFFENNYDTKEGKILDVIKNRNIDILYCEKNKFKMSKFKREICRIFCKRLIKQEKYKNDLKFANDLLSKNKFDFIHLNNHFSTNLAYIQAANNLNIKVIQHLRKNAPLDKTEINILKNLKFKAISVSNSTYKFYSKYLKFENKVIYDPVCIKEGIESRKNDNEISIIMPANFLELKGHDLVFDAMLNLKRDDLKLYIAGSGEFKKQTKEKLEKLIEKNLVINLGFVKNMDEIYPKFDYLLGFSENEGLPRVVIEALGYGLGVIFSNIDVMGELYEISSKKEDFHIINRTAKDLFVFLSKLKKSKSHKRDIAIINTFKLENYIESILSFYKDCE
ncbi:glycosyltransferase family 4 protein [Campylobacter corcagiensis]|uniref:Glycosyltransferase family 4 protein n=1 Tax=Campylobacter corcagiensis TaxID=1448857 RepID=A0A7M1LEK4_9BACT|nr:glycosyltransferase family 4 protein [Campylobacter corcagiensis]QKF65080.1 glycosyltransferase, family 1 [Campylobacter corcagiensis]QOQ86771.1 glycosyltransferase family 4 protein [Campylobacter corcagiensis]